MLHGSFVEVSNVSVGSVNPSTASLNTVVAFSPSERRGVIAMGVSGLISCILVSMILIYIIMSAVSSWRQRQSDFLAVPFIRRQIAIFVICLFLSDLIHSVAGVMQLKWALENHIFEGVTCTAQAAMMAFGKMGSTVWSCVIAAYTFSSIALGRQWSRTAVCIILVAGWSLSVIITIIGPAALETPGKGPFFGIAGDWCSITSNYPTRRLGVHYVPLFTAAIIIPVLYGLVFLVLRGHISFSRDVQHSPTCMEDDILRERVTLAKHMLWYPAAFLICVTPITITRLVSMHKSDIPDGVWTFGMFFIFLLGAFDSVIYATTRAVLKPAKNTLPIPITRSDASTLHTVSGGHASTPKLDCIDIGPVDDHVSPVLYAYDPWENYPEQLGHIPHQHRARPDGLTVQIALERPRGVV